jgi:hypothetical protein
MYVSELIDVGKILNDLDLGSLALEAHAAVADLIVTDGRDDIAAIESCFALGAAVDFMVGRPTQWATETGQQDPASTGPADRVSCAE